MKNKYKNTIIYAFLYKKTLEVLYQSTILI